MSKKLPWANNVDPHHYDSALTFLSLQWDRSRAQNAVEQLKTAPIVHRHPGDLLRAAGLEALPMTDPGVHKEIVKAIRAGKIEPVLAVSLDNGLVIADGFHRTSAAYHLRPFDPMPVKLAS